MSKTELPEAYRIGWVPFINTKIWLDSHPLIPRTETEHWANEVIGKIREEVKKSIRVLDLCAGSGAIGIAVLKELPNATVDFVELDETHHPTIAKNIRENGIDPARAHILGGNLFENVSGTYDFILSNPPYIDQSLSRVEESVAEHEPALALYGGAGGVEIIDRILARAAEFLTPHGTLWLEHEPEQVEHLSQHSLYQKTFLDQYGMKRFSRFDK